MMKALLPEAPEVPIGKWRRMLEGLNKTQTQLFPAGLSVTQ